MVLEEEKENRIENPPNEEEKEEDVEMQNEGPEE